jgi:hypothetical protein
LTSGTQTMRGKAVLSSCSDLVWTTCSKTASLDGKVIGITNCSDRKLPQRYSLRGRISTTRKWGVHTLLSMPAWLGSILDNQYAVVTRHVDGVRSSFLGFPNFMHPLSDHTDGSSAAIRRSLSSDARWHCQGFQEAEPDSRCKRRASLVHCHGW